MGLLLSLGSFLGGLLLLWLVCKLLKVSLKVIWKLLVNAFCGVMLLIVFNFVGGMIGLTILITPLRALIAGIFGIPGVILLLIFA